MGLIRQMIPSTLTIERTGGNGGVYTSAPRPQSVAAQPGYQPIQYSQPLAQRLQGVPQQPLRMVQGPGQAPPRPQQPQQSTFQQAQQQVARLQIERTNAPAQEAPGQAAPFRAPAVPNAPSQTYQAQAAAGASPSAQNTPQFMNPFSAAPGSGGAPKLAETYQPGSTLGLFGSASSSQLARPQESGGGGGGFLSHIPHPDLSPIGPLGALSGLGGAAHGLFDDIRHTGVPDVSLPDIGGRIEDIPGSIWGSIQDTGNDLQNTAGSIWHGAGDVIDGGVDIARTAGGVGAQILSQSPMRTLDMIKDGISLENGAKILELIGKPQQYGADQIGALAAEFYGGGDHKSILTPSDYLGVLGKPLDMTTAPIYNTVFSVIQDMVPDIREQLDKVTKQGGYSSPSYIEEHESAGITNYPVQFTGGRAVWEAMQSNLDDAPWYIKYPMRVGTDTISDPTVALPFLGEGAKAVGGFGKALSAADDASGAAKVIGKATQAGAFATEWGAKAPDAPFELLGKGIGYGARKTNGLFGLFNPTEKALTNRAVGMADEFVSGAKRAESTMSGGIAGPPAPAGPAAPKRPKPPRPGRGRPAPTAPSAGGPSVGAAPGPSGAGAAPGPSGAGPSPSHGGGGATFSTPGTAPGGGTSGGAPVSASGAVAPPGSGAGATATTVVPPPPISGAKSASGSTTVGGGKPRVTGFKTAKGSTYEVNGTKTTRTKSLHQGHDSNDVGLKPESMMTVYVQDQADVMVWKIAMRQSDPAERDRLMQGFFASVSREPKVGLMPFEIWDDGTRHLGNEIVEITEDHAAGGLPGSVKQGKGKPRKPSGGGSAASVTSTPTEGETAANITGILRQEFDDDGASLNAHSAVVMADDESKAIATAAEATGQADTSSHLASRGIAPQDLEADSTGNLRSDAAALEKELTDRSAVANTEALYGESAGANLGDRLSAVDSMPEPTSVSDPRLADATGDLPLVDGSMDVKSGVVNTDSGANARRRSGRVKRRSDTPQAATVDSVLEDIKDPTPSQVAAANVALTPGDTVIGNGVSRARHLGVVTDHADADPAQILSDHRAWIDSVPTAERERMVNHYKTVGVSSDEAGWIRDMSYRSRIEEPAALRDLWKQWDPNHTPLSPVWGGGRPIDQLATRIASGGTADEILAFGDALGRYHKDFMTLAVGEVNSYSLSKPWLSEGRDFAPNSPFHTKAVNARAADVAAQARATGQKKEPAKWISIKQGQAQLYSQVDAAGNRILKVQKVENLDMDLVDAFRLEFLDAEGPLSSTRLERLANSKIKSVFEDIDMVRQQLTGTLTLSREYPEMMRPMVLNAIYSTPMSNLLAEGDFRLMARRALMAGSEEEFKAARKELMDVVEQAGQRSEWLSVGSDGHVMPTAIPRGYEDGGNEYSSIYFSALTEARKLMDQLNAIEVPVNSVDDEGIAEVLDHIDRGFVTSSDSDETIAAVSQMLKEEKEAGIGNEVVDAAPSAQSVPQQPIDLSAIPEVKPIEPSTMIAEKRKARRTRNQDGTKEVVGRDFAKELSDIEAEMVRLSDEVNASGENSAARNKARVALSALQERKDLVQKDQKKFPRLAMKEVSAPGTEQSVAQDLGIAVPLPYQVDRLVFPDGRSWLYRPRPEPLAINDGFLTGWQSNVLVNPFDLIESYPAEADRRFWEWIRTGKDRKASSALTDLDALIRNDPKGATNRQAILARSALKEGSAYPKWVRRMAKDFVNRVPDGSVEHTELSKLVRESDFKQTDMYDQALLGEAGFNPVGGSERSHPGGTFAEVGTGGSPEERRKIVSDLEGSGASDAEIERVLDRYDWEVTQSRRTASRGSTIGGETSFASDSDTFFQEAQRVETGKHYGEEISAENLDRFETLEDAERFAALHRGTDGVDGLTPKDTARARLVVMRENAKEVSDEARVKIERLIDDLRADMDANDAVNKTVFERAKDERSTKEQLDAIGRVIDEARTPTDHGPDLDAVGRKGKVDPGFTKKRGETNESFNRRVEKYKREHPDMYPEPGGFREPARKPSSALSPVELDWEGNPIDGPTVLRSRRFPSQSELDIAWAADPTVEFEDMLGRRYFLDNGELVVEGPGPKRLLTDAEALRAIEHQKRMDDLALRDKERGGPSGDKEYEGYLGDKVADANASDQKVYRKAGGDAKTTRRSGSLTPEAPRSAGGNRAYGPLPVDDKSVTRRYNASIRKLEGDLKLIDSQIEKEKGTGLRNARVERDRIVAELDKLRSEGLDAFRAKGRNASASSSTDTPPVDLLGSSASRLPSSPPSAGSLPKTAEIDMSEYGLPGGKKAVFAGSDGKPLPYSLEIELPLRGEDRKIIVPMESDKTKPFLLRDVIFEDQYDAAEWARELGWPVRDMMGRTADPDDLAGPKFVKQFRRPKPGATMGGPRTSPFGSARPSGSASRTRKLPGKPSPASGWSPVIGAKKGARTFAPKAPATTVGNATHGLAGSHKSAIRKFAAELSTAAEMRRFTAGDPMPPVLISMEMQQLNAMGLADDLAKYGDRKVMFADPRGGLPAEMHVFQMIDIARGYIKAHPELKNPGRLWDQVAIIADNAGRKEAGLAERVRFGEQYGEYMNRAKPIKQATGEWPEFKPDPKTTGEKLAGTRGVRYMDKYLGALRVLRLGNPITGIAGFGGDVFGTFWQIFVGGKPTIASEGFTASMTNAVRDAWVAGGRDNRLYAETYNSPFLMDVGMDMPKQIFHGFDLTAPELGGELATTRLFRKGGKFFDAAGNLVVSQGGMDKRAALEIANRGTLFEGAAADHLRGDGLSRFTTKLRQKFPDTWEDKLDGILSESNMGRSVNSDARGLEFRTGRGSEWGGGFAAEDVRRATNDDELTQFWAKEINTARQQGIDKVNELMFSYEALNVDEILRRSTIFHYWLSRATPYHLRRATRNPFLLSGYYKVWQEVEDQRKGENMPPFLNGMFKVLQKENGVYAAISPLGILIPMALFDAYDQEGGFMRSAMSLMNPIFAGALGFAGMSDFIPDLAGTRPIERFVMNFVNGLKGEGVPLDSIPLLGRYIDMDKMQFTMPIEQFITEIIDRSNNIARKHGAPIGDYQPFDRAANEKTQMRTIGFGIAEEWYGPMNGWDDSTMQQVLFGIENVMNGTSSGDDFEQELLSRYGQEGLYQSLLSVVSPGGVVTRSAKRDNYLAEAQQLGIISPLSGLFGGKGDKTAASNAAQILQMSKLTDPTWVVTNNQFYNLGTPQGRQAYQSYFSIMYGDIGVSMTIGGYLYSPDQLKAMTDNQRKSLADEWLGDSPGGEQLVAEQRKLREEFLGSHPEYADYQTYKKGVLQVGADKWIDYMMVVSPNFKRQYEQRKAELARYGTTGSVADAELQQWSYSMGGFHAASGQPWQLSDSTAPVYDPTKDPRSNPIYSSFFDQSSAASGGSSSGGSSNTPDAGGVLKYGQPEYVQQDYNDEVSKFQTQSGIMEQMYGPYWNSQAGDWEPGFQEYKDRKAAIPGYSYGSPFISPSKGQTMQTWAFFQQQFPAATFDDFLWWEANAPGYGRETGYSGNDILWPEMLSGAYPPQTLLRFGKTGG